jgi:hypothetical protein
VWHGQDAELTVTRFEESDLSDRQKAALRLGEALLTVPSSLTPQARAAALEHFSPEEIVGMLYQLVMNTWNRVPIALGVDGPIDEGGLTFFEWKEDGSPVLVSEPSSDER